MRTFPLKLALCLCALAVLPAAVSCGSSAPPAPGVASLPAAPSAPAGSGAPPATSTVDRHPQETLNTTAAEWQAWFQTYWKCLKDHGVPFGEKAPGVLAPKNTESTVRGRNPAYTAAFDQCDPIKPLPAPELSPDTNPHYMDSYRKEIACLNQRGLKVTPLPGGGGWNYDGQPTMSSEQQTQVQFDCRKEAYGAR